MDELERIVLELERRVNGMAYVMRQIAFNRRLVDEDLQTIENRTDNDTSVSGSSE